LWFLLIAGWAAVSVLCLPILMLYPDTRAAVRSLSMLFSAKGLMILAADAIALIVFLPLACRMWLSSLTFVITPDSLITTHQCTRRRREIPWELIVGVERMPPVPFAGTAPIQFSRILIEDGVRLPFGHHLRRYAEFVEELRTRLPGRTVDPYPAWGSSGE